MTGAKRKMPAAHGRAIAKVNASAVSARSAPSFPPSAADTAGTAAATKPQHSVAGSDTRASAPPVNSP